MKQELLDALAGIGFLAFFASFWISILWLISRIGGWATLAKEYAAGTRPEGVHYTWRSLRIAPITGYNNCLEVTLSREGIYMVPFAIFRIGHRPLLIPWSCVGPLEEKSFLVRSCHFPIQAAGKKMQLWVPCEARQWLDANR